MLIIESSWIDYRCNIKRLKLLEVVGISVTSVITGAVIHTLTHHPSSKTGNNHISSVKVHYLK